MTYETVRELAGMAGLLIFVSLFATVLIYVFWPSNKAQFERARLIPLEGEDAGPNRSASHGR